MTLATCQRVQEIRALFGSILADLLRDRGGLGDVALVCAPKPLADDTTKVLITDRAGSPVAVLFYSPAEFPGRVAQDAELAEAARKALGPELGSVIPVALLSGEVAGRSFFIVQHFRSLSDIKPAWAWQRLWLRSCVLDWLYEATRTTMCQVTMEQSERDFVQPLVSLASNPKVDAPVREEASKAARRIRDGVWHPRYVLAHNDLWKDNLLISPGTSPWLPRGSSCGGWPFMIIDWGGSQVRGHAIYDLVRFAMSMGVSSRRFRDELERHCMLLGCDTRDAASYLLASLGYLGMHLECLPEHRYLCLVRRCWAAFWTNQK